MVDSTGCYGNCIETYTGIMFDLLDPKPEMVCIEDIAHSLSMLCRFNGHCNRFYSVAEHSIEVWRYAIKSSYCGFGPVARASFLHDASEAYLGDMTRPLKRHIPQYQEIEANVEKVIRERFNIEWDTPIAAEVKRFDNIAVKSEAQGMMHSKGAHWGWGDTEQGSVPIGSCSPYLAKRKFLETWEWIESEIFLCNK